MTGLSNQGRPDWRDMWHACKIREIRTGFWWRRPDATANFGDLNLGKDNIKIDQKEKGVLRGGMERSVTRVEQVADCYVQNYGSSSFIKCEELLD